MKNITIIIIANDELENIKNCLTSIRYYLKDIEEIIIVDNASNDGTHEWLQKEPGITWIYFDEGKQTYAKLLNKIIKELDIKNDMLILRAAYLVTMNGLEKMQYALNENEDVAVVGGISNGFVTPYNFSKIHKYKDALKLAESLQDKNDVTKSLGIESGAYLIKRQAFQQIGKFDENIYTIEKTVEDYMLRVVQNNYIIEICQSAIFFDLDGENVRDPYQNKESADLQYMYRKWGMHYFNQTYNDNLIAFIDDKKDEAVRVLEVGCDCGATLLEIKNRFKNAEIFGVELNKPAAKIASHIANVEIANIEDKSLNYKEKMFDYIIFGDVLEHLRDPLETLKYCKKFLKKTGKVIASIPNLMHISVIWQLINGYFTYTETGLLDKTHIHLFTYNEIIRMFLEAGYKIENVGYVKPKLNELWNDRIEKVLTISDLSEKFMYDTYQYVVRAKLGD